MRARRRPVEPEQVDDVEALVEERPHGPLARAAGGHLGQQAAGAGQVAAGRRGAGGQGDGLELAAAVPGVGQQVGHQRRHPVGPAGGQRGAGLEQRALRAGRDVVEQVDGPVEVADARRMRHSAWSITVARKAGVPRAARSRRTRSSRRTASSPRPAEHSARASSTSPMVVMAT